MARQGNDARRQSLPPSRSLSDIGLRTLQSVQAAARRGLSDGIDLVLVPQDLRTADPSLAAELALGTFGLAGAVAEIDKASPFAVSPPTPAWHDALHGFAWLTDLRAAGDDTARELARDYVQDWLQRYRTPPGPMWRSDLVARRTISWLTNAGFLLEMAEPREYDAFTAAVTAHLRLLVQISDTTTAAPRLLTRIASVLGGLCVSAQERLLQTELPRLLDELDKQILADGGHVSRHPGVIVEILLDLLPLRTCFAARDVPIPERFQGAIDRMLPMLRFMRLGDGTIARFNGMGGTAPDRLAAVLAYDEQRAVELEVAPQSRYVRMQRRQSTILVDAGGPPAVEHTSDTHAGALSFEMSAGRFPLVVCCGAPGPADQDWRIQARATASQSTLVLADQSSALLVRSGPVFDRVGEPLIEGPHRVLAEAGAAEDGAAEFHGSHDGYLARYGLLHHRRLRLTPQGDRLDGIDRLTLPGHEAKRAANRPSSGKVLPFALHFHIHPSAKVTRSREAGAGEITLLNGEDWRLSVQGADLGLEESIYLAHLSGPMRSIQLVARGLAHGEAEIRWRLERVKAGEQRYRRTDAHR